VKGAVIKKVEKHCAASQL